jgi:ParB-like chromosome segregation protein Spo0J
MDQNESGRVLVASTAAGEASVLDGTASNTSARNLPQTESTVANAPRARAEDDGKPTATRIANVKKRSAPAISKRPWREILPIHPAANDVPPASDEQRRLLRGDLQRNGLIQPVVIVTIADGPEQLLDGITRLDMLEANGAEVIDAAGRLMVKFRTVSLPDDAAALAYVLSLNLYRRHLSLDDRRRLLKKVLTASPEKSDRQVGKIVGLSHPTVAHERKKLEGEGDVEKLTTSTDTKGRKQPRKRAKSFADISAPTAASSESTVVESIAAAECELVDKQVNDVRATYLRAMTTFTKSERKKEITNLARTLGLDEQKEDKVDRVIQIFNEMNAEQRQRFIAWLKAQTWHAETMAEVAKGAERVSTVLA